MFLFAGNTGNIVNKCYYCSNCPQPFDRFDLNVMEAYSDTDWCAVC